MASLALAGAACGSGENAPAPAPDGDGSADTTRLEITVWPQGREGAARSRTLACDRGELEDQGCGAAARVDARGLAPTPPDVACTQIYGGPQEAHIEGVLRGEEIDVELSRANGCEIERWDRAAPLLELAEGR